MQQPTSFPLNSPGSEAPPGNPPVFVAPSVRLPWSARPAYPSSASAPSLLQQTFTPGAMPAGPQSTAPVIPPTPAVLQQQQQQPANAPTASTISTETLPPVIPSPSIVESPTQPSWPTQSTWPPQQPQAADMLPPQPVWPATQPQQQTSIVSSQSSWLPPQSQATATPTAESLPQPPPPTQPNWPVPQQLPATAPPPSTQPPTQPVWPQQPSTGVQPPPTQLSWQQPPTNLPPFQPSPAGYNSNQPMTTSPVMQPPPPAMPAMAPTNGDVSRSFMDCRPATGWNDPNLHVLTKAATKGASKAVTETAVPATVDIDTLLKLQSKCSQLAAYPTKKKLEDVEKKLAVLKGNSESQQISAPFASCLNQMSDAVKRKDGNGAMAAYNSISRVCAFGESILPNRSASKPSSNNKTNDTSQPPPPPPPPSVTRPTNLPSSFSAGLTPTAIKSTSLLVDDVLQLPTIAPPAVVELLRIRFGRDELYTHLGRLVLAINPYKRVEKLYSEVTTIEYSRRASSGAKYLPPHLYTVANDALENVKQQGMDQIVSISGESGSGKTESARVLISFIVNKNNSSNSKLRSICQQIMDGLAILESFGNAATTMNYNSSRHGRLIDLAFTSQGDLASVQVSDYLLERSRVVCHSKGEKNYHIFYEFIAGLSEDQRRSYSLDSLVACDYFATGIPAPTPEMKKKFSEINSRLVAMGFSVEELKALWSMVASVCHLGTIKFERVVNDSGSTSDLQLASLKPLQIVASLMKLSEGTLATLLTVKTTEAGHERLTLPLSPDQAFVVRDAIAKFIYAKLFNWLSQKLNISLAASLSSRLSEEEAAKIAHIGVLDIFGFEDFSRNNSLEQFCINFASESLHAYFLKEVIKMEQESYIRDGLKWTKIELTDNASCIDLLTNKKCGIMTILDDHCFMPNATDVSFLNKCNELNRGNPAYERSRASEEFGICHYAGKVWYQTRGFLEKNRDANRPEIIDLLVKSQNPIIASVFASSRPQSNQSGAVNGTDGGNVYSPPRRIRCFSTVSSMYQESLAQLLSIINNCQPHFIRCIRSNRLKKSDVFDTECVLDQLRCGGILDAARVRKLGYPTRLKHADFVSTYAPLLVSSESVEALQPTEACRYVLTKISATEVRDFQIGRTTVFMSDSLFRRLEAEVQTKRWAALSKWQNTVMRFLDERRAVRLAEEKRKRQAEEEAERLRNKGKQSSPKANDSAVFVPTPPLEKPSNKSDFLQEVITYLQNWQLVDDSRHVAAINGGSSTMSTKVAAALPGGGEGNNGILKTVVGSFMQTSFPTHKSDNNQAPNQQDVDYVRRILAIFVGNKTLTGQEQLVLATLLVVSCQMGGVDALLNTFHNSVVMSSSLSTLSSSPRSTSGKSSPTRLTGDFLVGELIGLLSNSRQPLESKTLLWILLLHVISSYDVSVSQAKLILSNLTADMQHSPSISAPHLVMFVYQKMYAVMRQLTCVSWRSNRILAPTLLEWMSNIRLTRMALSVSFVDGSSALAEVTSHSTIEEFASACIRTKYQVSSDIPPQLIHAGWAVGLVFCGNERVELWPEAKALDLISHIELPLELQPRGRFPGFGLIQQLPAVVLPSKSSSWTPTNKVIKSVSLLSGPLAQISRITMPGSSEKTTGNGPKQTSTPISGNSQMHHQKHVSFDDSPQDNTRQPSVSSTTSSLGRIDEYINNLFDFGATTTTLQQTSIINDEANNNSLVSGVPVTSVPGVSTGKAVPNIDTRSLYAHMNMAAGGSANQTPNLNDDSTLYNMTSSTFNDEKGSNTSKVSTATNVKQAAKVLDRFIKPDMINVQQSPSHAAIQQMAKNNNYKSTFTAEGNSLLKLITALTEQLGPVDLSTPFLTYASPQWTLVAFKAFLTPAESKSLLDADRNFLRFILAQIIGDAQSTKPGTFSRLSASEHTAILNLAHARRLTKASVLATEYFSSMGNDDESAIDIDFMKLVIKMAVDMKLYFAAIYPVSGVVDESGVSNVVTDVGLAPKFLSLISRRIDPTTSARILDCIKSFDWADIEDVVIAGESSIKVSVVQTGEYEFISDDVEFLSDRISAFTIEAQATVKFVVARDFTPSDLSDRQLVLSKNDVVYVIDAQPQDGLLYGTCRGRCGFFPIAVVSPMDFSMLPLDIRRHFADKRLQDCDIIVDAGGFTSENLISVEGWLQRADSSDRPSEKGDSMYSLVTRLSLRRQKEMVEQEAKGGNAATANYNSSEVVLLDISFDMLPLCAQCASLIKKFIMADEANGDIFKQLDMVSGILANGIQYPPITDEIFLQTSKILVSESTPTPQQTYRSLCLLHIIAKFFRCSDSLRPYIYQLLADQLSQGKNRELILECCASLCKVGLMGSRKSLPSTEEVKYCCGIMENRRNVNIAIFVRIFLPGQRRIAVYLDSCSLVREVVDAVMSALGIDTPSTRLGIGTSKMKISLTESFEYRLYYRTTSKEPFTLLAGASYVLDLYKASTQNEGSPQYLDLIIRRLSWLSPVRPLLTTTSERRVPPHPFLVDMLSFQMMRSWLEGNWSPLRSESQEDMSTFAATAAALQHRASIAATDDRPPSTSELTALLPRWVYPMRNDWLRLIQQTYFDVAAKLSPLSARRQLAVVLIKQCPLGAASFYMLKGALLPTSALRGAAIFGLNAKGVVILHPETRVPLLFASYAQILSVSIENNTTKTNNVPHQLGSAGCVQVVLRLSPSVMSPPDGSSSRGHHHHQQQQQSGVPLSDVNNQTDKRTGSKQAPIVVRLMAQPGDCIVQVIQHHMDLYAGFHREK